MTKPVVSVITVTYNSQEYIVGLLDSLLGSDYQNFEVVVIDSNSKDETRKYLLKHGSKYKDKIRVFFQEVNVGYAKGCNLGVAKSKGQYILFLNPDTQVTPNFLSPLIDAIKKDAKIAAVQPLVKFMHDRKRINLSGKVTHYLGFDWVRDYKKKHYTKLPPISFSGSAVLIDKNIFKKVGLYDEDYFMYYEDSDLSWRLRLFGYRIGYAPQSVVYHDYKYIPKEDYQPLKQKLYYCERNRLITILKNYRSWTLFILLPALAFLELCLIAFSLINGWGKEKFLSYFDIIKNLKNIAAKRKNVQKVRHLGDFGIFKEMETQIKFENYSILPIKYLINPILMVYGKLISKILKKYDW